MIWLLRYSNHGNQRQNTSIDLIPSQSPCIIRARSTGYMRSGKFRGLITSSRTSNLLILYDCHDLRLQHFTNALEFEFQSCLHLDLPLKHGSLSSHLRQYIESGSLESLRNQICSDTTCYEHSGRARLRRRSEF